MITRNGTPVARLSPVNKRRVLTPTQQAAWDGAKQHGRGLGYRRGPLDRDALHRAGAVRTALIRTGCGRRSGLWAALLVIATIEAGSTPYA